MSFATINWCKQAILLIVVICFYGNNALSCLALQKNSIDRDLSNNYSWDVRHNPKNLLAQNISSCQEVNSLYKEVYSFETENFYISICQSENNFYYHRQSKTNPDRDVFLPARAVFGGSVFRAERRKLIYFVGRDGDRYYSSVMQNTNEIVFEPELSSPPALLFSKKVPTYQVNFSAADVSLLKREGINYVSLKSKFSEANSKDSFVCSNSKSYLDPNLESWEALLGKSPDVAYTYAIDRGHNFVYDDRIPDRASIKTKEGTIINLNIATVSETIERVCIQSIADNF